MPRGADIAVRDVSHAFAKNGDSGGAQGVVVVDNVSLTIPRGQFVAMVGPSGCGKTTLLNMAAGLTQSLVGDVTLDGDVITSPSRHTGYMFARDALVPWRTAAKNVEIGLEIRGLSKRDRQERAREALAMVHLDGFENHYPSQLSQGMRQRVALARTFALTPDTLLMDEPFAALDTQTKQRLQTQFLELWDQTSQTVLWVTHDLKEAVLLADRVIVFSNRPARIVHDIEIDLPRPRNIETLQFAPEYTQLYSRLWSALEEGAR